MTTTPPTAPTTTDTTATAAVTPETIREVREAVLATADRLEQSPQPDTDEQVRSLRAYAAQLQKQEDELNAAAASTSGASDDGKLSAAIAKITENDGEEPSVKVAAAMHLMNAKIKRLKKRLDTTEPTVVATPTGTTDKLGNVPVVIGAVIGAITFISALPTNGFLGALGIGLGITFGIAAVLYIFGVGDNKPKETATNTAAPDGSPAPLEPKKLNAAQRWLVHNGLMKDPNLPPRQVRQPTP